MIGGLKSCSDRGYERLAPFLMGSGEERFKVGPGLDLRGLELLDFTVFDKQPCVKNELESDAYELIRRVERVSEFCVFDASLYLIDECFDGVVGIVGVA